MIGELLDTMDNLKDLMNVDLDTASKSFKKGSILQHQGDKTLNAYYVKKGLLRSYSIDQNGKEHIFMFAPEGWIIADIESQEFDQPAVLFIECLEDAEVVVIDKYGLEVDNLSKEQLVQHVYLLSRRIGVLQKRMIMMMSAPAVERYEKFLLHHPDLPKRVPQRMIASYLGITPEALSKIRGELARTKQQKRSS